MRTVRLPLLEGEAAQFNKIRDHWSDVVAAARPTRIATAIASILPRYVNRKFGYAWPTDAELATKLQTSERTIGKGMSALEKAGFIQRETTFKPGSKRGVAGRQRRIYLSLPVAQNERNISNLNGTKRANEWNSGGPNIPDRTIPDSKVAYECGDVGVYAHAREEPFSAPTSWANDKAFLRAFDDALPNIIGDRKLRAGSIERVTQEAFDVATNSDPAFMPIHSVDVIQVRDVRWADWFRNRTSAFIHQRSAA